MSTTINRTQKIAEGLTILSKYLGCETVAEHDIILSGPSLEAVNEEDKSRLEILGWFVSEEYECWAVFT